MRILRRAWIVPEAFALAWLTILAPAASVARAQNGGKQDFVKNCAECHGEDGKGHGSSLYVLPIHPGDITQISKRNGGVFPFQAVEDTIDGRKGIPSHKRFDMPFWGVTMQEPGKCFSAESDQCVKERIEAIVRYVESLQQK